MFEHIEEYIFGIYTARSGSGFSVAGPGALSAALGRSHMKSKSIIYLHDSTVCGGVIEDSLCAFGRFRGTISPVINVNAPNDELFLSRASLNK